MQASKMQTIERNAVIHIPPVVAICPICGATLIVEIDEWEENDDGSWQVSDCGLKSECVTEPEVGSKEWADWFKGHYRMPYVDWLPVDVKLTKWVQASYRFVGIDE